MKLRILDLAEADLLSGYQFYEQQSAGIGVYFIATLLSDIESLRLYAGIHRQVFGFHRLLSRRFPYAVYYTNLRYLLPCCHREVREARRGDPAGLLRRFAPRNDRVFSSGDWYYTVATEEVKVWRVLACRRNPRWIRDQLGRRRLKK